ncbi:MAG: DUF2934 domain-containing protein [Rhodoferax sp.]|uniref:DUF2934 domain-containing protein n=1 Tax=Rhodoferax sp. TaxID=50421 RepID=UPI00140048E4|nr:DUF2934 domain-containing protein [Rhodoferax sp.]NDP39158.1 DUF2934 domain-containing protein [Rhodoferax sp.]
MKHQHTEHRATTDLAAKKKPVRSKTTGDGESQVGLKATAPGTDRDELIRQTAYSFYVARSYVGGHELEDWLQAEAEVDQMTARNGGAQ